MSEEPRDENGIKMRDQFLNFLYLIKGTYVNATAERNMFRMKTKNPFLFKPFLRKGVVGSECGWKDWRHNEGQDVQAVEQNLLHGALNRTNSMVLQSTYRPKAKAYSFAIPHPD